MERWTEEQEITLMGEAGKFTPKQIAEDLGRSEKSVRSKAWRDDILLTVPHETARGKRILTKPQSREIHE